MGKLVVGTFLTLDGVMQAPGGPDEDREGGFAHGGWSVKHWDDMMGKLIVEQMLRPEALLLGRKTYQIFAGHWPRVTDPNDPVAAKLNSVRKYVASRTLRAADWAHSSVIPGDAPSGVARLKEQTRGEIQVAGSANLIQTLLRQDLVDEFHLWIFPVVVGPGKRLFDTGTIPRAMRLVDTKVASTGVSIHRYARVGPIEYGSFALEQ